MSILMCTLDIDAPASEVWRVLTTPELVREWAAVYIEGLSIRTSWRVGEPVTWRAPNGVVQACGKVAAFRPERLLKFEYESGSQDDPRGCSETFEIKEIDQGSRLQLTTATGSLAGAEIDLMSAQARQAVAEIKSLAEESARIHRLR